MTGTPSLLIVSLFAEGHAAPDDARAEGLQSLIERLEAGNIAVRLHGQRDSPPESEGDSPVVYLSVGGSANVFAGLWALPLAARRRWVHYSAPDKVEAEALIQCWLNATDPCETPPVPRPVALSGNPLVSVFTAAYRTGERLHRAYRSLLSQTHENWEWVIADDSGDGGETFKVWIETLQDPRVVKLPPVERSGRIGTVKRRATDHCRGEILVELDHDDELTPDALGRIVAALHRHPECGLVFGEAAEVYEEALNSHWYGWDAAFGFLTYWRQWDPTLNRTIDVPRTASLNWRTVRHLVGLPNHPRAWARWAYDAVGGHRPGLVVADDYDLIARSLFVTRPLRVPELLYRQYRRHDGANQTFVRNQMIQVLCGHLERFYRERLEEQLRRWSMPELGLEYRRIWSCDQTDPRWAGADIGDLEDAERESHLYVFPPAGDAALAEQLAQHLRDARASGWEHLEIVAVGALPEPLLLSAAAHAPPGRLRWWNTGTDWRQGETERYGRLLCTASRITLHGPAAGDAAWAEQELFLRYVDAFTPAEPADRQRNRLALLRHLQSTYGYRRYLEIGTDQDEVFSRMNGFDLKVGVDPNAGGTHRMTSDAYFAWNRTQLPDAIHRFDLILIDGLHEWSQVVRDIDNALECLEPGGTIVLHDCMPFQERHQIVPRPMPIGFWTGDTWKAIFLARRRPDLDIATGRFDWGVAVLRRRPNSRPFSGPSTDPVLWGWDDYLAYQRDGLNPMGWADLLRWLDARSGLPPTGIDRARFMVAAHCPSGQASEAFLHALVRLFSHAERERLHLRLATIGGDDPGQASRGIAAVFLSSDCSHLLVVDANANLEVEDFTHLFTLDRDVAAAIGVAEQPDPARFGDRPAWPSGRQPASDAPVAMALLARPAVERIAATPGEMRAAPPQALCDAWRRLGGHVWLEERVGLWAAAPAAAG